MPKGKNKKPMLMKMLGIYSNNAIGPDMKVQKTVVQKEVENVQEFFDTYNAELKRMVDGNYIYKLDAMLKQEINGVPHFTQIMSERSLTSEETKKAESVLLEHLSKEIGLSDEEKEKIREELEAASEMAQFEGGPNSQIKDSLSEVASDVPFMPTITPGLMKA